MIDTVKLAYAIGRSARRERLSRGATLDEMAAAMRQIGFRWTTSRVVDLESGRVPATLGNLLAVCAALTAIGKADPSAGLVTIAELLPAEGAVEIASGVIVTAARLRDAFDGRDVMVSVDVEKHYERQAQWMANEVAHAWRLRGHGATQTDLIDLSPPTLADQRAAKTLGVSMTELQVASHALWGRMLSDERDARGSESDSAQRRGRVTRELLSEMAAYIARTDGESNVGAK